MALPCFASIVYAHGGRLNAQGCHAGSQPYHCHTSTSIQENITVKPSSQLTEDDWNDWYCQNMAGQREVKHHYSYGSNGNQQGYIIVDCETNDLVIEGGLDKRSSLDSIQQALFFAYLIGKKPAVVIYDTDGQLGQYEYRIQQAAQSIGLSFKMINRNALN